MLRHLQLFAKIFILALCFAIAAIIIGYFCTITLEDIKQSYISDANAVQISINQFRDHHGEYPQELKDICENDRKSAACEKALWPFFYSKTANGYRLIRLGSNWYEGTNDKNIELKTKQ